MERMMLPYKEITLDSKVFQNARTKVDKDSPDIIALASDIKSNGLLSPLVVWVQAGKYHLIAGFRRHAALSHLALEVVPVHVYEGDYKGAVIINLMENLSRRDLTTYDLAMRCKVMAEKPLEMSGGEIGKRLSAGDQEWSKSYVNKLIRLTKELHPEIIKDWSSGPLTPRGAVATIPKLEELVNHKPDTQIDLWLHGERYLNLPKTGEDGTEGEGEEGEEAEKKTPEKKSVKRDLILVAIAAIKESPAKSDAWKAGAVEALKWACSDTTGIKGVFPVKKAPEAKENGKK
jgi:ParB/RepB/Spo0J family partition protein